jgi:transposase-like protein
MSYSPAFRESIIKQALQSSDPQKLIARKAGIGYSTLQKWLHQYRQSGELPVANQEKRPRDWSAEERFNALVEVATLEQAEKAAWCRQRGLHSHHLDQWHKDMVSEKGAGESVKSRTEARQLRAENNTLKKELRRKDKALAETAALLVLKKKADMIWGDGEDS